MVIEVNKPNSVKLELKYNNHCVISYSLKGRCNLNKINDKMIMFGMILYFLYIRI